MRDPYGKAVLLREYYFPPPPEVDLSNIEGYEYSTPVMLSARLIQEEVIRVITKFKKDNIPGPDNIPNRILYLIVRETPTILVRLF